MSKKVWFSLPAEYSPENSTREDSPVFQYREFSPLRESWQHTNSPELSQFTFRSPEKSSLSVRELSQYSFIHSMEHVNTTGETFSTNESQDISSSQQESTVSDGPYGYDDGNDSSSLRDSPHEEVVNSVIMEVSGELMHGKLTPNKQISIGSESSDISDDDIRHRMPGGVIAKYPESSTGLSDNDWNPYATESDTNQTPRSPRSNTSDDNRVGFVSKANINIKAPAADDVNVRESVGRYTDKETITASISVTGSYSPEQGRSDHDDVRQYATMLSEREDLEQESPDTARSAYTEDSRSGRQSSDSLRSEEYKRDSLDVLSEPASVRHSLESGPLEPLEPLVRDRRVSAESAKSYESGDNSSQPSVETVRNMRTSHSDKERMGESNLSGRHSVESYGSQRSDRSHRTDLSEQSYKSSQPSVRFDRSDRLERLSKDDNLKELMQFESGQRPGSGRSADSLLTRDRKNYPVSTTRLTARVEKSPERSPSGYISVSERERLIADSPVQDLVRNHNPPERRSFESDRMSDYKERSKPTHSETSLPSMPDPVYGRSPSEVSMRRVSNLFEETKRQVRDAVALPRPDPSGSEERFPLNERMSWNKHDASFISQGTNHSAEMDDRTEDTLEKSRELEPARSLTSEEVARVLSKYSDYERENIPKKNKDVLLGTDSKIQVSAFDSVERSQETNGHGPLEVSDDELSKRVKAILADSHKLDNVPVRDNRQTSNLDYIPNTIDYSRLHKDLEEIQDSLHDIPKSNANDSLPLHLRNGTEYQDSPIPPEFVIKSMETTGSGLTRSRESGISEYNGRESGASEYGRRLVWDHGADLQYDPEYDGKFLATNTSTDTLSQGGKKRYSSDGSTDTLVVRPDSVATNATDNDVLDFESEGTRTLTGSDITRAERIVKQVMNRQAEGDLKENVEDIIARYRTERKDLDHRFQSGDTAPVMDIELRNPVPDITPIAAPRTEVPKPTIAANMPQDKGDIGLAARVYKILTSDTDNPYEIPDEQGDRNMVSTVSSILAKGRPQEQVNGILTEALARENEMLKKMATKDAPQVGNSSLEDSGVNDSQESLDLEDADVRKRLQWSQMSSPEKGADKSYLSEWNALREVTKAPYSSVSNAKSLLSTQLKKMSERNFDKSVELRTPFRQAIQCWPVHGVERTGETREPWVSQSGAGAESLGRETKTLGSDRFYITDKDRQADVRRHRTYSDPFEVSTIPHLERDPHPRSRSEEPHDVSDLSQYSELALQYSPTTRRTASSPTGLPRRGADEFRTPKAHRPEESWSYEYYTTSLSDSSDPRHYSDSSSCHGNKWGIRGYQGQDRISEPEDDIYGKFQRSSPVKLSTHFRTQSLDRNVDNKSPTKIFYKQKPDRHSRSRTRQKSPSVKFNTPEGAVRSISEFSERQLINRIAKRNDDVYDLLTDKSQNALNIHELKDKLNDLQEERSKSKGENIGNHGNNQKAMTTSPPKKKFFMRSRHARPVISPTDSDTSGSRRPARPRPYRPAGSRDMYYTESGDDTNESGTTVESTHPGSDDAIPPYIPRQYLGSRQDEPDKHPTGIYSANNKNDDLSTIDENSLKDDKEKALTASTGSNKENNPHKDEAPTRRVSDTTSKYAETGYQTGTSNTSSRLPESRNLDSGYPSRSRTSSKDDLEKDSRLSMETGLKTSALKSREEFLREFEEKEHDRRRYSDREQLDHMGTSVRSDPGGALDDLGSRFEYRESTDGNEFKLMEPEPGYPQERLRYSRSRSDTDLASLSPTESQRYSSPMQPGTRFMELSTQPSPIYHHDSLTIASRHRTAQETPKGRQSPQEIPRVDDRRSPQELPKVDDRRVPQELLRGDNRRDPQDLTRGDNRRDDRRTAQDLPRVDDRRVPQELPRGDDRRAPQDLPRVDDRRSTPPVPGKREAWPVEPLEPGDEPVRPLEQVISSRSQGQARSQQLMEPVDLGADPARLGGLPRSSRPRTPVYTKQKEMEAELEKMNKELSEQVKEIQEEKTPEDTEELREPMSKKAQVLRQVLEQEYIEGIPPNINDMWARFKEKFDGSISESSLNSTRLDALSGLIQNPTQHFVVSFLHDKEQEAETQKKLEVEKAERMREERKQESERLKRMSEIRAAKERMLEIRAAEERSQKRAEMRQKHGLSEEESNGSITEMLAENDRRKEQRRHKKERSAGDEAQTKKRKSPDKTKKEKSGRKSVDKETETNIKSRARVSQKPSHSDSMDTLFSIPEDASFEHSPTKLESELKSRQRRQRHIIDPLMKKLRDKIKLQRDKIDKERRKELQRVEKLKKLEMLLNAKKGNHLSDRAIDVELQNVSTTTSFHSDTTHLSMDSTVHAGMSSHDSDHSSELSTTLKDSTGTPIRLQVKRYPELEERVNPKRHYVDTDSTESSDFSNIIVEKLPQSKSEKRKSDRKSGTKERKVKVDENGQRIRKERKSGKKKSKEVFGVEVSDDDIDRQVQRYGRYVSPQRQKHRNAYISPERQRYRDASTSPDRTRRLRDAATMYPSPITVSPPQRRRIRDVIMRSEAIQTSPSIRSTSPTHSYDEVPVAPVPTMCSIGQQQKKSLRRRPSPSPPRSLTTSRSVRLSPPRRISKSPPARKSSKSPGRGVAKSPARGVSSSPPPPRVRKDPPMWKPESESPPPENSMFTPEGEENMKAQPVSEAKTWFIAMKPSQPWRKPLKERQAFSVQQESWEPTTVSQKQWKKMVHDGVGTRDKGGDPNVSTDTKFDLDPEGQPINDNSEEDSDETDMDLSNSKPLSKMSLQEAFMIRKQEAISRLRQRQKRLNLAAEERKMEAYLKMERDRLFNEERKKEANPEAHPYSDNLFRPARRVITKEEMKDMTQKRYKKLPEVIEKQKLKKKEDDYSLNRLKARLYNRKIQKQVLVKAQKWGR